MWILWKKFSALESYFAKYFLDKYIETKKIPTVSQKLNIKNYIYSVSWRILHDDLFRLNSFENCWQRLVFEEFELYLREFLHNGKTEKLFKCKNYIFKLESLFPKNNVTDLSDGILFGYPYYDAHSHKFMVLSCYAGLLFVTTYTPAKTILINFESPLKTLSKKFTPIKKITKKEFIVQMHHLGKLYEQNITSSLQDKINQFYDKH